MGEFALTFVSEPKQDVFWRFPRLNSDAVLGGGSI